MVIQWCECREAVPMEFLVCVRVCIFTYEIYVYTHTHTNIYIYIYVYT